MSKIGFYRYKIENATSQDVNLYINNVLAATKKVIAKDICDGFKMIRWIDENGQFRFYPFNTDNEIKSNPKQIGEVNRLVSSLSTGQSESRNVGYTNNKIITLRAQQVGSKELELLSQIYSSPRVHMYTGDLTTFDENNWVEVTITGDNNEKRAKRKYGVVEITVTLPTHNTLTMK